MKLRFPAAGAMIVALAATSVYAGDLTSYHVGNSLTEDLMGFSTSVGLRKLAKNRVESQAGSTYTWGWHDAHGQSLPFIYDNAGTYDSALTGLDHSPVVSGYDARWDQALPKKHWDVVTLEPYPGATATLATDTAVINDMINTTRGGPNNSGTRFYVYAAWPATVSTDVNSSYNAFHAGTNNADGQASALTHDYWRFLTDRVRQTNSGVKVIPVGEVFDALDVKARNGEFNNIHSALDFHRDDYHTNSVGANIAAWTAYATIFNQDPTKETLPYLYTSNITPAAGYSNPDLMTDYDRAIIQQTIWQVLNDNGSYTGVPEPTSMAVIGLGAMALLRRRGRRVA